MGKAVHPHDHLQYPCVSRVVLLVRVDREAVVVVGADPPIVLHSSSWGDDFFRSPCAVGTLAGVAVGAGERRGATVGPLPWWTSTPSAPTYTTTTMGGEPRVAAVGWMSSVSWEEDGAVVVVSGFVAAGRGFLPGWIVCVGWYRWWWGHRGARRDWWGA